jgi:hypothetical protein
MDQASAGSIPPADAARPKRNRSVGGAVYWGGKSLRHDYSAGRNDGDEEESRTEQGALHFAPVWQHRRRPRRIDPDTYRYDCAVHAADDRRAVGAHLEETMPVPRPLFGPATLTVSETKSALLQLIERAQLEILYRHPR